jgi:hypothetical protein
VFDWIGLNCGEEGVGKRASSTRPMHKDGGSLQSGTGASTQNDSTSKGGAALSSSVGSEAPRDRE